MSAIASPELKQPTQKSAFMPVQIEMLRRLDRSPVDLFIQYETGAEPVLYHRGSCPLEREQASRLAESGVKQIYVRSDQFQVFTEHLLETIDSQEQQVPAERYAALQLAMAVEIEHAARLIDCGPYVAVAEKLGRDLTSLLVGNNILPRDLFRLARHDFNTFSHVTNVASYGVILAEKLGLCQKDEFETLAKAAILHDIGKRFIPAAILSKPAKLDAEERAIIETHPQRGYEELCERQDMTEPQLLMVYQHHERFDGKGYPVGFQGEEIHPWARMLAIVDVFDAMTGTRPYRRPCSAREAMDYICKNAGTHFDAEMVACWNSTMAKT
ncbi:MAG TPA: HD domain-containing phosphohydrolase [Lacipirellulaceae bacterium]|jgi:HD-GYP domain-containing protein (c-di-GMP phosphodiesterase class II)|nr:HD domain-containing phosphohydrolase [Lacipirellulaceae bacterium]